MSCSLVRCIGLFGLLGGIAAMIGLSIKNDFLEVGGIIVCLAASFWLAFLVKPESDKMKSDARFGNKIP